MPLEGHVFTLLHQDAPLHGIEFLIFLRKGAATMRTMPITAATCSVSDNLHPAIITGVENKTFFPKHSRSPQKNAYYFR
jgi:hypothetical protein